MSPTNISKDLETTTGAARCRRGGRTKVALSCAVVAATATTVVGLSGVANAATVPTAQLSFSPATISAGTQPEVTFLSQDVPSGSILYLQKSSDDGQQWTSVAKTTNTQGTANIAALPQGAYEFRIEISDNGTELAVSAPATLTVTASGGAPAPVSTATASPSGSGIPWLDIVVKPVWDAIIASIITWIFSLF